MVGQCIKPTPLLREGWVFRGYAPKIIIARNIPVKWMPQIAAAMVGVASALLGALLGGVASYVSTRSMRRVEWKLAHAGREMQKREAIYLEFLGWK